MIFSSESIKAIIENRKSQTRRLVKEGEIDLGIVPDIRKPEKSFIREIIKGNKTKWYVNQTLAVQSGRGKPAIWYCTKCGINTIENPKGGWTHKNGCRNQLRRIRIRILSIKKERILDTHDADAIKEGYTDWNQFIGAFSNINYKHIPKKVIKKLKETELEDSEGNIYPECDCISCCMLEWNPEIWVLEFQRVDGYEC